MPCLYVCTAKLEIVPGRMLSIVKFGRSKYDEPWARLATHCRSRDNPWGSRISPVMALCISMHGRYESRSVEQALCSLARKVYARINRWEAPTEISLPLNEHGGNCPSGEWLMHPRGGRDAVMDVLCLGLAALESQQGHSEQGFLMYGHAYEAFSRAAFAWNDGAGYERFEMEHSGFRQRRPVVQWKDYDRARRFGDATPTTSAEWFQ